MGEKKAASEVDNANDSETNGLELPADSVMKKEGISANKIIDEKGGVEEAIRIEASNDNMDADSNETEADKGDQLLKESLDKDVDAQNDVKMDLSEKEDAAKEVAAQELVEREESIKETLEQFDNPKEAVQCVVVREECENVDAIEKKNKSSVAVLNDGDNLDDDTEGAVGESKELAVADDQVKAVIDEGKESKEKSNGVTENTKDVAEDGQTKELSTGMNEEEIGEDRKDSGHEKGVSENEEREIKSNLEEKSSTVENGVKREEMGEKIKGSSKEKIIEEEGKGIRKRKRGKSAVDTSKGREKDEQDPTTPVNFGYGRPVRQRKSVERLVASVEKDVIREIFVEKGPGLALKDIPNVASKLSKKRNDETFKQLHTILFGMRGKATQMKNNILQFSGFVWDDNEEKHKLKVKEKFIKLVKERLLEFCDVLDIPITNKVTTKKEEVVVKIMEFLAAPYATTDVLVSEKEQPEKSSKRKRSAGQGSMTPGSSKGSRKQRRTSEKSKKRINDESDADGESNHENGNGKQKQSEDDFSEKSAGVEKPSGSTDAADETFKNRGPQLKKSSTKVESSDKKRTKPNTPKKTNLNYSEDASGQDVKNHSSHNPSSVKARSARKSSKKPDTPSKVGGTSKSVPKDTKALSSKAATGKKNHAENVKEQISIPSEPSIKNNSAKTGPKTKPKEEKLKPSDEELRDQVCQVLKEVDFNTATFTDILKLLVEHFKTDLTSRKASIKLMMQEELTKMADDGDEEDEETDDAPEDPAKVKA